MDKYDELLKKADNLEKKLNDFTKYNAFTLRDYFAGQALAGMGEYLMLNRENLNEVAESCYKIADAMVEYNKLKK